MQIIRKINAYTSCFEKQVERTPDNVAVVFEGNKLTYRELNQNANKVANYLKHTFKLKRDDFVGILTDRSEELLIGILGVFKAGGAYIPIDPDYPVERQQYILKDSEMKVVLKEKNYGTFLDKSENNSIIDIEGILFSVVIRLPILQ